MIKILHISDLHFYKDAQTYNMQEILLKEAKEAFQDVPEGYKLLVITGDYHNYADKNYDMAEAFLNDLISAMGLNRKNDVFMVPGNHDVGNKDTLEPLKIDPDDVFAYTQMIKNGKKKYIEKKLKAYLPYCNYVRRIGIYPDVKPDSPNSLQPASIHVRQWKGKNKKLNILHLNTTLAADGSSDKSNQMIDVDMASNPQIWKDSYQSDLPCIALGHNHFYDLADAHQTSLQHVFFSKNVSAYLCGDTHRVNKLTRNQMIALEAGTKQGRLEIPNLVCAKSIGNMEDDYSDFGYYLHEWNEDTDEVKVIFRRWKPEYISESHKDESVCGFYHMRPISSIPHSPQVSHNLSDDIQDGIKKLKKYLSDRLATDRRNHPSFRLMDTDDIDERLYPGIKDLRTFEPVAKESDSGETCPVWRLIQSSWTASDKHNIIIQGDGGIGKTVTLLSVPSSRKSPLRIPAIYIPLHKLVTKDGKRLSISDFLQKKYRIYFNDIDNLATEPWENGPKLLLLLDGFNEVPVSLRNEILCDIRDWDCAHPGTQLIAVSRPTIGISLEDLSDDTIKISLQSINRKTVRSYLHDCDITVPEDSSPIWKDLVYPLFLTLYVKTDRLQGLKPAGYSLAPKQAKSGGALIWNFLQRELLRELDDDKSEDWVIRCALACEFIIPFIAYRMAKKQRYTITRQEAIDYIEEAIKSLDIDNLPKHLNKLFQEYQDTHFDTPSFNSTSWKKTVLQDTGILVSGGTTSTFGFMHQNFRDCLAGLYLVNQAEIAEKFCEFYPPIWQESHHPDLVKYASELMEAETFSYLWEQNRSLLPIHHTGTINLLEIRRYWNKKGKLNFSGMNLCNFSLVHYMKNDQNDLSLFRKSELTVNTHFNLSTFEAEGHKEIIGCVAVTPDGLCISGSDDGTLRVWNPHSGECLHILDGHMLPVNCVAVTPDGLCVSGSYDYTLRVWNPHSGECLQILEGHKATVNCVSITPDGLCVSGSDDHTLRVWNPHSGECLHVLDGHERPINCVAVTPDGLCVSGSYDGTLRVWNPHSGECLHVLGGHEHHVNCVAVTPDGLCVSGSDDGTLRVWNPHSGECLHVLGGHEHHVNCVAVTPDGLCVSGSYDGTLRVWNPHSGECLYVLGGHKRPINCVAVTPDGLCVSGSDDHTLRVWNPHSGECLRVLDGHKSSISCVAVTPDGLCVSGSDDHTLRVWNPHSGECLHALEGHEDCVNCVAVTPDGLCVSGSYDETLRVWNPHSGECLHIFEGHKHPVNCVAVTPDGLCVSGSYDEPLRVWNPHSGECLHVLGGHKYDVNCVAVTPDGLCVSGSYDDTLRVWNPHSGECLHVLEGHEDCVNCVAVTPDGLCVSGSDDGTLRVWNPHSGECLHVLDGHERPINCVAVTPDGLCVSGSDDHTLRVWNPHSGECLHALEGHEHHVNCVAVTPDGLCVSGSYDGTLRVWNPHSGECLYVLGGHKDCVNCVAVTPDGLCVSGSYDGTLRVWNPHSGECLYVLGGHKDCVNCVAVTPDGLCVSGSYDGTLRVWNPHSGECLHIFKVYTLNLRGMDLSKAIMDKELKMILSSNGVIV